MVSSFGFAISLPFRVVILGLLLGLMLNDQMPDGENAAGAIAFYLLVGVAQVWREGIEFDFQKMRWRKYHSFLGVRLGKWVSVLRPEYVSISHKPVYTGPGPSFRTFAYDVFALFLVNESADERVMIYFSDSYPPTYSQAKVLEQHFAIPVYYQYGRYNELATEEPPFS